MILLHQLATLYEVNQVVLCSGELSPDDRWEGHITEQIKDTPLPVSILPSEEYGVLTRNVAFIEKEKILFFECDRVPSLTEGTLGENHVWVSVSAPNELPLRLDSNFVTYQARSPQGLDLHENYKVKGGRLIRQPLGHWTERGGLRVSEAKKWDRRSDLRGARLTNIILPWMALNMMEGNRSEGLYPDLLQFLSKELNFTFENRRPKDGLYGKEKDGGGWTGIIGELVNKSGDLSSAGLIIKKRRQAVIDFSIVVIEDQYALYQLVSQSQKMTNLNIGTYLTVFNTKVWLAILVAVVAIAGAAVIGNLRNKAKGSEAHNPHLLGIWLSTSGSTSAADVHKNSAKILFLSGTFFSYMVTTCFCVDLIAYMTAGEPTVLKTCLDIKKTGGTLHTVGGGSMSELFSKTGIFKECREFTLFEKQCNSRCFHAKLSQEGSKAYLFNSEFQLFDSDFAQVKGFPVVRPPCALAFPKDSELAKAFNHHILKLQQTGAFARLHYKWIGQHRTIQQSNGETQEAMDPIALNQVYLPIIVVLLGSAGSVAVGCFEKIFFSKMLRFSH